jgi:hypothetical protein
MYDGLYDEALGPRSPRRPRMTYEQRASMAAYADAQASVSASEDDPFDLLSQGQVATSTDFR